MASSSVQVSEAQFPRDAQVTATLFLAYAEALNVDLTFQNFKDELAQLPGKYAPGNGGALLLAYHQPATDDGTEDATNAGGASLPLGNCIGCIAIRRHQPNDVCEFKRLYIIPEARRLGAGAVLISKALDKARELGYTEALLDTLSSMVAARKLYARYGFEETEKYYDNPLPNVVYYKAKLV
ncbi:acetyltransferase [Periconia macrospinosa]|uniref:Acetyltransferase n=1 Tax=Periconia macrospinosa TaxID=97972 RepID=A0A2V1DYA2_9PLEO|nr:acetyltransferase [Periconia macrospinosa]